LRDSHIIGYPMRFMNPQISSPGGITPLSRNTLQPSRTKKLQNGDEFRHAGEECPKMSLRPPIHL
jgi:hypothetical protein